MNTEIKKRIFTIACRKSTAVLTDSKNMTSERFDADKSTNACIDALNSLLDRMPKGVKLDYSIAILLPESISFLAYEDTRNYWLANGCKKNGEPIDVNTLNRVKKLHHLIKIQAKNIQIFNQKTISSPLYRSYARATWNLMNEIIPQEKQESVSCNSF